MTSDALWRGCAGAIQRLSRRILRGEAAGGWGGPEWGGLLLSAILLTGGCGYQLRLINVSEEQQREARRQEEVTRAISTLRTDLKQLQKRLDAMGQEGESVQKELTRIDGALSGLQRGRAELHARLDEINVNLRLLQGGLEKGEHRFRELAQRMEGQEFRLKESTGHQASTGDQVRDLEQRVVSLKTELTQTQGDQADRLRSLSEKVMDLVEHVPPLLNQHTEQLQAFSDQLDGLGRRNTDDTRQISKSLTSLSKALDQLGQKMASKIDEQDRAIRGMSKRMETLETQLSKQRPPSSRPSPAPSSGGGS